MTGSEALELVNYIGRHWPRFEATPQVAEDWHEKLRDFGLSAAQAAVDDYGASKHGRFAPSVFDVSARLEARRGRTAHSMSRDDLISYLEAKRAEGFVPVPVKRGEDEPRAYHLARIEECVKSPKGYLRITDFLARWVPDLYAEAAKKFFAVGAPDAAGHDANRWAKLIDEMRPGSRLRSRWEHEKDVILDTAIERCKKQTGKTIRRIETATVGTDDQRYVTELI